MNEVSPSATVAAIPSTLGYITRAPSSDTPKDGERSPVYTWEQTKEWLSKPHVNAPAGLTDDQFVPVPTG
jgi:hypothetical protein